MTTATESQHTPGSQKAAQLAEVFACSTCGGPSTTSGCRLHADARAMLALLKGCVAYFDNMQFACGGKEHMPDERWLTPIRALLATIEGA